MTDEKKVIVFGATGPIGSTLVDLLVVQQPQWHVVAVTRHQKSSSSSLFPPTVSVVEGDVEDLPRVLELTKDVDIIFCCVGLVPYARKHWAKHWPVIVDHLLQAVVAAPGPATTTTTTTPTTSSSPSSPSSSSSLSNSNKKKLIFCDNLYAYGAGRDEPISTSTATVAPSTKSKRAIRALLRGKFQQHMQDHPQTLSVVGGAEFFGPRVTNASFLGDTFTRKLVQGQTPLAIGSASVAHDFCYTPDFAKALYLASIQNEALDRFWICPHAVHGKTVQDIANDVYTILEEKKDPAAASSSTSSPQQMKKKVKVQVLSKGLVSFLSLFMGFMWEMGEMMDSFTKPYLVDDSEFCSTFHVKATPYEQTLKEYVEFYEKVLQDEAAAKKA